MTDIEAKRLIARIAYLKTCTDVPERKAKREAEKIAAEVYAVIVRQANAIKP